MVWTTWLVKMLHLSVQPKDAQRMKWKDSQGQESGDLKGKNIYMLVGQAQTEGSKGCRRFLPLGFIEAYGTAHDLLIFSWDSPSLLSHWWLRSCLLLPIGIGRYWKSSMNWKASRDKLWGWNKRLRKQVKESGQGQGPEYSTYNYHGFIEPWQSKEKLNLPRVYAFKNRRLLCSTHLAKACRISVL